MPSNFGMRFPNKMTCTWLLDNSSKSAYPLLALNILLQ
jgi:hypothetical protein